MIGLARGAVCNLARSTLTSRGLVATRGLKNEVHPGYKTLKPKQEKFGAEDGTPVYLKGGVLDRSLYVFTMAACAGSVLWEVAFFYKIAQ